MLCGERRDRQLGAYGFISNAPASTVAPVRLHVSYRKQYGNVPISWMQT